MVRVEVVVELSEEGTTFDVWRSEDNAAPGLLYTLKRRYHVPPDALGWCARVAMLTALNSSLVLEAYAVTYDELDARC